MKSLLLKNLLLLLLTAVPLAGARRHQRQPSLLAPSDPIEDIQHPEQVGATSRRLFLERCAKEKPTASPHESVEELRRTGKTLLTHALANRTAPGVPPCRYISQTQQGDWIANQWQPTECELGQLAPSAARQCLFARRIGFFGDSLLRNIWEAIVRHLQRADRRTHREYSDNLESARLMRCDSPLALLEYKWTPSAFGATVAGASDWAAAGEAPRALEYDTLVLSWAAHDMHRAAGEMLDQLRAVLGAALDRAPRGQTIIVSGLHKLWPQRCADGARSACALCNAPSKEARMREAILEAASCVAQRVAGTGRSVLLFDSLGLTSTTEAMRDGPDALHYGANTSRAQAHVLLRMLCESEEGAPRLLGALPPPRGCCGRPRRKFRPRPAAAGRRADARPPQRPSTRASARTSWRTTPAMRTRAPVR